MRFSTDEIRPFFKVRQNFSQVVEDAQGGHEIVVTKHGEPAAALIAAADLFRYREMARLLDAFVQDVNTTPDRATERLTQFIEAAKPLLAKAPSTQVEGSVTEPVTTPAGALHE